MVQSALREVWRLVDDGQLEKAVAAIDVSQVQFSLQPRALIPMLEDLDRKRDDRTLRVVINKVQQLNLLPLEAAIFDLRMRFRAADHPGALSAVERVLAISPSHVEALRTGGRIANLRKEDEVGVGYWERLAQAACKDPEAALQAARTRFRAGHFAPAFKWACQAAENLPTSTEPLHIAADAGVRIGLPAACDPILARLVDADKRRAMAILSRVARDFDCETVGRVLRALQPRLADDTAYQDLVSNTCSRWLMVGLEHELASRESEAATHYRAVRTVRPGTADAQVLLDRITQPSLIAMRDAFGTRDFPDAVTHGAAVVRVDPLCFEAWQTVGRAHFALGNLKQACDAFGQCTVLNGDDARTWLSLGLTLNQLGARHAALDALHKAQSRGRPEVRAEVEILLKGLYPALVEDARSATLSGDLDRACKALDAVLDACPDYRDALETEQLVMRMLREQIRILWASGSDTAVELCRRYLKRSADDSYVSTVLGRTLMRMRDYAEALPVWEGLSALNPADSHFHLQVARCCRSLKLRNRGLGAAEAALRLDPALQEATEVSDYLRTLPPESSGDDEARQTQPA